MKLTMLGTGNAAVTECYNTCFILSQGNEHFLVDAGGGNQILKHLKDAEIRLKDIHHIFVTHEHIDHVLGVVWLIRMIGQQMNKGAYDGELQIYCFAELAEKLKTIVTLTVPGKICKQIGERIHFIIVAHDETKRIIGFDTTFFDIGSTKAKQFGFTMQLDVHTKFTCLGDEPFNEANEAYVTGSSWLMHEAFCLYEEREQFKPYEKHHSTVKEACELAQRLQIPNLILYHTEDKHIKNREQLYTKEGSQFYNGNLYVPNDLDSLDIALFTD